MVEIPVRLHPIASSIGLRNTPSENSAPMPTHVISADTPTTTHP